MLYRRRPRTGAGLAPRRLELISVLSVITPALSLVCALIGCGSGVRPGAVTLATSQTPSHQYAAAPEAVFPIPVIEVSGSASQMGDAHGRALGGVIRTLHDRYFH